MARLKKYSDLTPFIQYLASLPKTGEGFELKPFKKLLRVLNNPHKQLKGIHVLGTNGKGSTALMCQQILSNLGFCVGLYTSPHLHSHTERIRIGDRCISKAKLLDYFEQVKKNLADNFLSEERLPTFFEVITAIAFLYFVDQRCDYVVCEAGLGGKLDATSVASLGVTIITNVSLEHTNILGKTITDIAEDKACAIKKNSLVITSAAGKALEIVKRKTEQMGSSLSCYKKDFSVTLLGSSFGGMQYEFVNDVITISDKLSLLGKHQLVNAADAIQATFELSKRAGVDKRSFAFAVAKTLRSVRWAGRFEVLQYPNPLGFPLVGETKRRQQGRQMIILDGAHNLAGVKVLADTLRLFLHPKQKVVFVFGVMKDKPHRAMLEILAPLAAQFIFYDISLPEYSLAYGRVLPAKRLQAGVETSGVAHSAEDAFSQAFKKIKKNEIICFCGSLYLLGEVRKFLLGKKDKSNSPDALHHNPDFTQKH